MNKADIKVIDVRMVPALDTSIKCSVDVLLFDSIRINEFKVFTSKNGADFVVPPRKVGRDGRWYEIVLPLNEDVKKLIDQVVLEAYADKRGKI